MDTKVFTAIIHKEKDIFVAECPEIGTVSQGFTIEEALSNLKEATELYFEEFPTSDVSRSILTTFEVSNVWTEKIIRIGNHKNTKKNWFYPDQAKRQYHVILKKIIENEEIGCVVPLHKELAIGTLKGILRQAKISPEEFIKNIY